MKTRIYCYKRRRICGSTRILHVCSTLLLLRTCHHSYCAASTSATTTTAAAASRSARTLRTTSTHSTQHQALMIAHVLQTALQIQQEQIQIQQLQPSSKRLITTSATTTIITTTRGGGGRQDDRNSKENNDDNIDSVLDLNNGDGDDAMVEVEDTITASSMSSTVNSIFNWPSLFQLNNAIKADASVYDDDDDDDLSFDASNSSSSRSSTTTTTGRGGALVKTARPIRSVFQWLSPMDTSRVAPYSDRLLHEDNNDSNNIVSTNRLSAPVGMNEKAALNNRRIEDEFNEDQFLSDRDGTKLEDDDEDEPTVALVQESAQLQTEKQKADTAPAAILMDAYNQLQAQAEEAPNATTMTAETPTNVTTDTLQADEEEVSPFVSSGYWSSIDKALTLGYAESHPGWRVSRRLRTVRKNAARLTGMHGVLSGKKMIEEIIIEDDDEGLGAVRRRIAILDRARFNVEREELRRGRQRGRGFWGGFNKEQPATDDNEEFDIVEGKSAKEIWEDRRRHERVKEIDKLISESQKSLQELACEKDVLQRRPNPLWNYTTDEISQKEQQQQSMSDSDEEAASTDASASDYHLVSATRTFSFPPPDLVDEYLDMLFSSGRLVKLNHTDLWKNGGAIDDDDDDDDDELSSSSFSLPKMNRRNGDGGSGNGNWLLRHGLGEKIGEAVETAGNKAVCAAVMSFLARLLSSLHGVNVMQFSDIRLYMEQSPDLPPLAAGIIPGSGKNANYAQGAIEKAMRRGGSGKKRKKRKDAFIQRDAVVETLLSHCQISAPLLQLFPIAWQRALLGNIISLIAAVFGDFLEGVEFQILGHKLSFAFAPITEADMLRNLGSVGEGFHRHRARPEQFEAAVQATAEGLAEELKFLDRWHERALGGGVLRLQVANLIARLVLTLTEDVLRGSRMDLWTAHAGGPRLLAGLEYRTTPDYMDVVVPSSS